MAVSQVWVTLSKRDKEKELVFVLGQFHQALLLYSRGPNAPPQAATAQVIPALETLPQQLDDLLRDPRAPNVRRYLRRLYIDPMTGKAEWGLVQRQGRIIGVYSLSADAPLGKKYTLANIDFEKASKYSDWQVVVMPTQQGGGLAPGTPGATQTPLMQPGMAGAPAAATAPQPVVPPREPVVAPPPPRDRPTTTDRDLSVMSDRELSQYCTQLNLLDVQACAASKALTPLGKTECMKTASARQAACMLRQNTLPPLYLSSR